MIVALIELYLSLLIPLAFPFAFARMAGRNGLANQGRVVLAAMVVILALVTVGVMVAELAGNDRLPQAVDQAATASSPGGNLEGKR